MNQNYGTLEQMTNGEETMERTIADMLINGSVHNIFQSVMGFYELTEKGKQYLRSLPDIAEEKQKSIASELFAPSNPLSEMEFLQKFVSLMFQEQGPLGEYLFQNKNTLADAVDKGGILYDTAFCAVAVYLTNRFKDSTLIRVDEKGLFHKDFQKN